MSAVEISFETISNSFFLLYSLEISEIAFVFSKAQNYLLNWGTNFIYYFV